MSLKYSLSETFPNTRKEDETLVGQREQFLFTLIRQGMLWDLIR